jgi:hypothetical protein
VSEQVGDAALPTVLAVTQKRGALHELLQHVQDAIVDYDQMATAARRLGDRRQEGMALAYRGRSEEDHHDFERAETTLRAALVVADEGYDEVRQIATGRLIHCMAMVGRKAEAGSLLQAARELARQRGDRSIGSGLDGLFGLISVWDGRFDVALTTHHASGLAAISPAEQSAHLWGLSLTFGGMGEYQVALALRPAPLPQLRRAVAGPRRHGKGPGLCRRMPNRSRAAGGSRTAYGRDLLFVS